MSLVVVVLSSNGLFFNQKVFEAYVLSTFISGFIVPLIDSSIKQNPNLK